MKMEDERLAHPAGRGRPALHPQTPFLIEGWGVILNNSWIRY